ncbi:stage III sporulation protein AB [Caldanaerobacter subterraneus subsp. tengcongensis MB4]|uniref:Stage III sporulation protein spoIIIAB n=1 Tax=Caldanaerobacter subterraneus subsp. tengcongensis (strain DSM 15242 / JCM 11007 / NBRC 100824 / MB4) TaxID=273068 RepID=Q8RAD9_CALS4|nr:stage III sporulation protein SpoIIIAB [Caldanaerobacter subterraneus]AAM24508.1 stage III sporulation protein spoIIIAB [Caldanaerobacter subterraneus subsp. tengcongensis MB4]MCS3915930.1 stage III sporulation protein AB [Caldanaerobacter subterraneus subsp. tengcongensis MB4]
MKLIGVILTIFSTTSIGYLMAMKFKARRWILKSLISALNLLKLEITYSRTPLERALKKVALSSDKTVGELFQRASLHLGEQSGLTAGEAWEKALNEWERGYLSKEEKEILRAFGTILGISDAGNQEKNFNLTMDLLKRQLNLAEEEGKKNEKLYQNLGFLLGLAIVILFL